MAEDRCPLCGCTEHHFVFSERKHNLISCDACEMLYISPYPADEAIYETVAEYEYEDLGILDCERHYASSVRYYDHFFPKIAAVCEGGGSVLDVGCGTGRLLELCAKQLKLDCVGIELNSERAAFARAKAGCEVLEVPIQTFESERPFDVITLMNLFSHVPDLEGFFASVRRLLSPAGKIVLKVGEIAPNVKKAAVYDWQIPDHLQFLGLKTVGVLAEKCDLKVIQHDRIPLAEEMFSRNRWKAPGRSKIRNLIKSAVAITPGALSVLKGIYNSKHRDSVYSSFIVLQQS